MQIEQQILLESSPCNDQAIGSQPADQCSFIIRIQQYKNQVCQHAVDFACFCSEHRSKNLPGTASCSMGRSAGEFLFL